MKDSCDAINSILENNEINVIQQYIKEKRIFFLGDGAIVILSPKEKTLQLSLHASMKPDIAGIIAVQLSTFKKYTLVMNPPFMYDDKGAIVEGTKAFERIDNKVKDEILKKFIREQRELYLLHNAPPIGEMC